jgi:hypothetical protein
VLRGRNERDEAAVNATLMQIVVDAIEYFGTCDERTLHPDHAVRQLESICAALKQLSASERRQFVEFVELAAHEAGHRGDAKRERFLRLLPQNAGIDLEPG